MVKYIIAFFVILFAGFALQYGCLKKERQPTVQAVQLEEAQNEAVRWVAGERSSPPTETEIADLVIRDSGGTASFLPVTRENSGPTMTLEELRRLTEIQKQKALQQ